MNKSKESIVAIVVTVLLLVSMGACLFLISGKDGAEKMLSQEKLKSEKMLSEKQSLAKEIEKLKKDISLQSGKNGELSENLKNLKTELANREAQLKSLDRAIAERDKYRKQLEEANKGKALTEQELAALRNKLKTLEAENGHMQIDAVALKEENAALTNRNDMLSSLMANNYGLEAHRKNDKLTVKAKRAKEIVAGFDLPYNMTEDLRFTITTPEGKKVSSMTSKNIHYVATENVETNTVLVASTDWKVGATDFTKRITLTFKPEEKLDGGIYHIDIYAAETYLGSSQIRLK